MKVLINVDKDSIMNCDMGDTYNCVIAKAVMKSVPLCMEANVGMEVIGMRDYTGTSYFLRLPPEITKYIRSMLGTENVSIINRFRRPFTFELEVPDTFGAEEPERRKLVCVK